MRKGACYEFAMQFLYFYLHIFKKRERERNRERKKKLHKNFEILFKRL